MVEPVSLTFLIGAIAGGVVVAGLVGLIYKISQGKRARHFPAEIQQGDGEGEPLLPAADGGAAGAAAAAAGDNHDDYPTPPWLDIKIINVAICGEVCVGKSTLVNFLCELPKPGHEEARTGRGETTGIDDALKPLAYPLQLKGLSTTLSRIKRVTGIELPVPQVLDLPGAGTCKVPANEYIRRFGLRWMTSVIVVVGQAIKELDTEIIKLLIHFKVPFYVVQTKLDVAIEDAVNSAEEVLRDDQDLDAEGKRAIATQALENERSRLQTSVLGDAGGPGYFDPRRLFLVCAKRRKRNRFPQDYGFSDDTDRLKEMMLIDAQKSYSDVAGDGSNAAGEGILEQSSGVRQRREPRAPSDLKLQ